MNKTLKLVYHKIMLIATGKINFLEKFCDNKKSEDVSPKKVIDKLFK